MEEFNPKETAKIIFKEINEYTSTATKFLSQERFFNLTPLLAIEICEQEMPPPAEHLSLAALSCSHPDGPGVVVDSNVTQMLLNAGIEKRKAYQGSIEVFLETHQMLITRKFVLSPLPNFPLSIDHYQPNDPLKNPPQKTSYRNDPEVYLLENVLYPRTQSLKVTVSKKVDVKLARPIF